MKSIFFLVLSILSSPCLCHAGLIFGLDAVKETSEPANDATLTSFNSLGVDITAPTLGNWATASNGYNFSFNSNSGNVIFGGGTSSSFDVTYKVDLTGTHDVTFDKFAVAMQRAGNSTSNVISNAQYSVDGTNFFSATVQEVAVGGNGGGNNVGPADTITNFRTPNGLGGSITPQQTYILSGLGAAGTLNSGSFYLRFNVGSSSSSNNGGNVALTTLDDRYDLTTNAMGLAAANSTNLGADDGYDMAWYGTAVASIPEPNSMLLFAFGAGSFCFRRRK